MMENEGFVQSCRKHSLLVEILSILLGINSLIATNGLWVELPLMVPMLPEGWQLPAYLTIIIQIANVGPLLYIVCRYSCPTCTTEKRAIYIMLLIGLASSGCMVFFWHHTTWFVGKSRSVVLFVLTFFLALVDSTSSIVCLPFMASLKSFYITFYMIGESLGGFLPSIVATVQGVEEYTECINITVWNSTTNNTEYVLQPHPVDPQFSAEMFFVFLFAMMLASSIGFFLLNCLPMALKQHETLEPHENGTSIELQSLKDSVDSFQNETSHFRKRTDSQYEPPSPNNEQFWASMGPYSSESEVNNLGSSRDTFQNIPIPKKRTPKTELLVSENRSKVSYYTLLALQWWVSALGYGVFPSIQSFSCLPYGSKTYHLTVILVSAATPVASIIALLLPTQKTNVILLLTFFGTLVSSYAMTTAVMSPQPVLLGTTLGKILVTACWVLFTSVFGYVKVAIAAKLRFFGHKALFWCGVLTQFGSASAAIVMFLLVSVYNLFHEIETC